MRHAIAVGLMGLSIASGAAAQTEDPKEIISNGGLNHTLHAAPVVGQPFSAEQVQRREKRLEDGTKITHSGHHAVMRDSSGRVRVEQPCGCKEGEVVIEVYVLDPVARTLIRWRTGRNSEKVAFVARLPETLLKPTPHPVKAVPPSNRPQPIVSTETLPTEIIDNLPMTVTKTTTIVPAGRSGNDAPITRTHTVWTSQDLKLTFREQWVDPRVATRTVELANFSRAEPSAELFRVPPGYQVKDVKQAVQELSASLVER